MSEVAFQLARCALQGAIQMPVPLCSAVSIPKTREWHDCGWHMPAALAIGAERRRSWMGRR